MIRRLSIMGAVMALLALLVVSPAVAKQGGTDRPFKADLAGQVTFEFGAPETGDCGEFQQGWDISVITHTEATGNASHLGRTQASFSHCPLEPAGYANGHLTLTAANGDMVDFEYDDDGSMGDAFQMHVVGGSGRFEGASGLVTLYYWLNPAMTPDGELDFFSPWGWWASIEGTISY